ncbi:hypothetical protein CRM22_000944 [Opisthorchis felineus]|uniref:DNA topoisomerase n=1 Tax=Opisthorchis felineus TaxID=147828 RepID=A0A4S2MCT0_OPIFE|nr:hypothetical protein CRM22_000944 [Opisthorchis felineus]
MSIVFMVAEKPSLAESISKSLSRGRHASRRGFNGACSVHEWTGSFMGEQVRFKMTSVCGHVMTTDFLSRYNNWDRVDPIELFVAPIEKKEANPNLKMVEYLRKEAKNSDTLILWLDCDKEGENICFEVIDCVHSVMIPPKRIFRAHFSAITDEELSSALRNLRQPNKNESLSVDARQELDLRIGCAFTRFQTKFFQGKYGNLNSNLVSFGPCQTPTLGFCVKRHDRIQSFKPESFWRIKASVTTKEKVKPRPQGLNTVEMLRVASACLGIGPHAAMAVAERLYTSGYINYPRTETTTYPSTFDLRGLVQQQAKHPQWGDVARDLLASGLTPPRKGHDAGDHPPIAPMRMVTPGELGHDAARLYEFIAQHFLATNIVFCPYCFSHPPFANMPKGSACHLCLHPTCPQSMESRAVDACPECPNGLLVLDDSTAPKYRFNCNRCPTMLLVSDAIKQISVGNVACEKCSAMHLHIKLDPAKLPKAAGDEGESETRTTFSECAFCSDVLCHLFQLVQSRPEARQSNTIRGSSNTRGGGRRGRRPGGRTRAGLS